MAQDTCTIDGCEKKSRGRRYCSMHAERIRLTGSPGPAGPLPRRKYGPICTVDGCENAHEARGYCEAHYTRLRRTGSVGVPGINAKYKTPEESFAARTRWDGDCLIWTGGKSPKGYGWISTGNDQKMPAHRYAWERANGPIPDGMLIDHTCWTKSCVNVKHLRLATLSENARYVRGAKVTHRTTGVRGVYPNGNRFEIRVTIGGKQTYFGTYPTIEEAARAVEAVRAEHYGEFAGGS